MAKVTTKSGRSMHEPVVCHISRRVQFNTPGIGADFTVEVGHLPEAAICLAGLVVVHTAFNAATTNVLTVGTDTGNDEFFDASTSGATVTEGTAGAYSSSLVPGYTVGTGGEVVYVKYTQTGTAATTGDATVIITYVPRVG